MKTSYRFVLIYIQTAKKIMHVIRSDSKIYSEICHH